MKHEYSWSVNDYNTMTIWEDNTLLATIEDCCDDIPEELFKEVVYELREIEI